MFHIENDMSLHSVGFEVSTAMKIVVVVISVLWSFSDVTERHCYIIKLMEGQPYSKGNFIWLHGNITQNTMAWNIV